MVSTRILRSMFGLALALAITAVAHAEVTLDGDMPMDIETHSDASLGTLLSCDDSRCLWADKNGRAVGRYEMMRQLMREEELDIEEDHTERRRLESYVQYVEDVHRHAQLSGVVFGYKMGVTPRHLYLDDDRVQTPQEYVEQEFHAHQRRLLEETVKIASDRDTSRRRLDTTDGDTVNWCTTKNPLNKNVCTPVKSQSTCGSCWAFAASDAIETAVAVSSDAAPLALSPQQFLDCSRRNMTVKFDYCWAAKGVSGATWLNQTATWASRNNGCNGGMTHGAFADAAEMQLGLLSELVMPYTETTTDVTLVPGFTHKPTNTPKTEEEREKSCVKGSENSSATINDWQQAVGKDCSATSDIKELLKLALQKQPISVAINSDGSFKDYKGGIYSCPNNGDFTVGSSQVNHAIVLVGHGIEGSTEYWILKNSYGFSWGEKGFIRLKMDDKIQCGVAIFPVIPLGASKGAAKLYIDGGGDKVMLWLSPTVWIIIAAVTTIATTVLTAVGVVVHRRRRDAMQNKDAVMG